jgi:hypothetical protein
VGGNDGAFTIARDAEISVINEVPSRDPYSGAVLDRPAICARIRVPYRMSLFPFLGGLGTSQLTITSNAEVKS